MLLLKLKEISKVGAPEGISILWMVCIIFKVGAKLFSDMRNMDRRLVIQDRRLLIMLDWPLMVILD